MALSQKDYLIKRDPKLARIIHEVGDIQIELQQNHFYTLVDAIASQQLSGKASDAILTRLRKLYPKHTYPTPNDILATSEDKLRTVGFSRPKIVYIKDLEQKFEEEIINPAEFSQLEDEAIILRLTEVKGIGRWTAEVFMMFSLGRPDILPADDLGIQRAIKITYNLDEWPKPKKVIEIGEKWRPYRTLASRYLWQSLKIREFAK